MQSVLNWQRFQYILMPVRTVFSDYCAISCIYGAHDVGTSSEVKFNVKNVSIHIWSVIDEAENHLCRVNTQLQKTDITVQPHALLWLLNYTIVIVNLYDNYHVWWIIHTLIVTADNNTKGLSTGL